MTRTITRSYDSYAAARAVVTRLEAAGIDDDDISIIGRDGEDLKDGDGNNAAEGAGIGAGVGGAAGLLAGIGMLAIPGIGPVVAAGWLASTAAGAAAGAAAGGIVGMMTSAGVDEDEANVHAETIRRGGAVVSVRADDEDVATAEEILDGAAPVDTAARRDLYRKEGWTRFDETAEPYRADRTAL